MHTNRMPIHRRKPEQGVFMSSNVRSNYIYSIIYRLSICVLPLIVTPYIARVLGVTGNGVYTFSSTVACYFILFGKLGLDNYGNRTIAICRDDAQERSRAFTGIYIMQLATSALAVMLYIMTVRLFFHGHALIYGMQLLYVLSVLFDVSWFFYGMEKFRLTTIRSLISRALLIVAVFLFVKEENDLWIFTLLMSLSFLLEQMMLLPFVFRYVHLVRVSRQEILSHLRPNIRLFLPIFALSVYNWMDKIMLGMIKGSDPVAYYNYAESIINLPKGIVVALGTVMLPRISNMVANHQLEESRAALRNSMKLIGFICCLLCFGIAGVSPVFVPFFLGPQYEPTIDLTIQLAIVMLPMGISDVIQTQYLIPYQRDRIYIRSIFIGALLDFGLNLIMIPPMGPSGAVISTIVAEVCVVLYQISYIRDVYSMRELLSALGPFIGCGVIEFTVTFSMRDLPLAPPTLIVLQMLAGGCTYLLCYAAYVAIFKRREGGLRALRKGKEWLLP